MNKKLSSAVLLISLVLPIILAYTFFHYQKKQVRKEVKQQIITGIDKEELVLLKFTEEESQTKLKWEHSKEFEYNQEMYDIVEKEIKGDTIYYWCWWDNEETKLNKKLDNLLAYALGKDPKQNENQERLANFYKSLYCEQSSVWHLYSIQTTQTIATYEFNYLSISHTPPVPPPEIG